jgi:PAS domain S-box-containing protein
VLGMPNPGEHVVGAPRLPFSGAALQQTADAVVVVDAELRVASWNRAAAKLYGMPAAEAIGRSFAEHVTCRPNAPARKRSGKRRRQPMLEDAGLVDGSAIHVIAHSGRAVPVRVSILPLRRCRSGARHFAVIVRDNSEQSLLEALLQQRLDFEMLLSELSMRFNQIAEEDVDCEIEQWLARLVQALDVDRSSLSQLRADGSLVITHSYAVPGRPNTPLGPANQSFPWLVSEFLAGRTVLFSRVPEDFPADAELERRFFTGVGLKAGIGIPVMVSGSVMCVLTFGTFREPRNWSKDVIARLNLAGNAFANAVARSMAKQRLEEKQHELVHLGRVAAMGELASVIAHELDQPLTVVVSNAEAVRRSLLSGRPDLDDADEALQEITDAALRASEIVRRERQLLRKGPRKFEQLDLNDALREIELFIRAEARQFGARVVMDLLTQPPAVRGDRVQLQQVVFNLVRNALQAMRSQRPESRTLTITIAAGTEDVTLSVADAGPPVDPLVLRRMFEPFYTTKASGLGMGLSISKSIIDAHGGRIRVGANPSGGLTISVSLPRKRV